MTQSPPDAAPSGAVKAVEPGRRSHRRRSKVLLGIVIAPLLLAMLGCGTAAWWAASVLASIPRSDTLLPPGSADRPDAAPGEPITFLIAGTDLATSGPARSDVMILGQLNGARDRLHLISLPRDIYLPIPGHGMGKLNAAFAWGGMPLAVQTVEKLVGLPVQHAVWIDFDRFVALTESVGGVRVWNQTESREGDYTFPRGRLHLAGDELLVYVRQRKGLPEGDLGRNERQRAVLKAMLLQLASREMLTNPAALTATVDRLAGMVTLDSGLTDARLFDIASSLRLGGTRSIVTLSVPIRGFDRSPAGESIDLVDDTQLAAMTEALQQDRLADYVRRYDAADAVG